MSRKCHRLALRERRREDIAAIFDMLDALNTAARMQVEVIEIPPKPNSGPNTGKFIRDEASDTAYGSTEGGKDG